MLKNIFKFFLAIHITLYRLTRGKFGSRVQGLRVLLLTSIGRRTNHKRTTPLGYFVDGDRYIVIASNAGFDSNPAWFYNLNKNPHVTIEVGPQKMNADAEVIEPAARDKIWAKLVSLAPGYAKYEKKTSRVIPLVALKPLTSQ
jgi:deazaflavin-dependent oxidoreductase (nitroreductase family)